MSLESLSMILKNYAASLAITSAILAACGNGSTKELISPDGSLILRTRIETSRKDVRAYRCVMIQIRDRTGMILHEENTRASNTMRWDISWESNQSLRLVSADIGTLRWTKHPDRTWRKQ
jgi:hypothetical protein